MSILTRTHVFTMAGSDVQSFEFQFKRPGVIKKIIAHGATSAAGHSIRLYDGEYIFPDPIPMAAMGTSFGYVIPLEDGLRVGPGATITLEITDTSGAGNVVTTALVGSEADPVAA